MKKTAAVTACLVSGALVFGAMTAASAASPKTASGSSTGFETPAPQRGGGFTAADWQAIARTAEAAGDTSGAKAARSAAKTVGSGTSNSGGAHAFNLVTSLGKKALLTALRHAGPKLPKKMQPYANKMANVLEDVTEFQEGALVVAFQHVGIPLDIAQAAALWCVVFLGV